MGSSKNIAIIDYQMSNLFSVKHACDHVGAKSTITSSANDLSRADALILPGVGAFKNAMDNLKRLGLVNPIKDAIASGTPFFGICLGLQLLFDGSDELGGAEGLGIIPGQVIRFPNGDRENPVKVPHIGWNNISCANESQRAWESSPLRSIAQGEYMYFVHSFYVSPKENNTAFITTEYGGINFCSAISQGNLFACQFHPEKSGKEGLKIYRNWISDQTIQGVHL